MTTIRTANNTAPLQESWSERTTTRPGVCISLLSAAYCDLFVMPSRSSPLVDASSQILVQGTASRGDRAVAYVVVHSAACMKPQISTDSLLSTPSAADTGASDQTANTSLVPQQLLSAQKPLHALHSMLAVVFT
jgi:hypothetical protein